MTAIGKWFLDRKGVPGAAREGASSCEAVPDVMRPAVRLRPAPVILQASGVPASSCGIDEDEGPLARMRFPVPETGSHPRRTKHSGDLADPSSRSRAGAESAPGLPPSAAEPPLDVGAALGECMNPPTPESVIEQYADVPEYLRLLTGGPHPVYRLPADQQEWLIATDLGGRRANIIRAALGASEQATLQPQVKALKGELRAKGYQIVDERVASPGVMRHIVRNAGKHHLATGRGEPLRLFNAWIERAARAGATDLHVDVRGNVAQVRVRVDGRLESLPDGAGGLYPRADAIDALAAGYNNTRQGNNVSQYTEDKFVACMISLNLPGLSGQLRYQNFKGREGPKAVIRILRSGEDNAITFDKAGYSPSQLKLLREAARSGKGIVLIAGVTSSGKSTSLKCLIETLPGLGSKAIYTVEDPIEYEIRGAHQIEVLRDLADEDLTASRYADTMRALMRGDPDGVMLGEIRDRLTALFALQIAETGHLAMGTVHAHLISTIIPRLTNDQIGVSRQALTGPNILNLLVYQALVPKLCGACAEPTPVAAAHDPDVAEIVDLLARKYRVPVERLRWQHLGGCPLCQGRGTLGKTIVAEMLRPDRAWLRHVRDNDDDAAVMHFRSFSDRDFSSPDMTGKTVFEHTLWKALQGEIDVRNCEEFDSFSRFEVLPPRQPPALIGGRP
jgi:general secretion pathway protein E